MKIKNKLLILFIFVNVLLIGIFPINVISSVPPIDFTFNRDILVDSSSSSFDSDFNLRPISAYLGHYNATFGFLDDTIGSTPSGWNTFAPSGSSVEIIDVIVGHRNFVGMDDNSNSIALYANNSFTPQTSGIIEFWYRTTNIGGRSSIKAFNELGQITMYLSVDGGFLRVSNGGTTNILDIDNDVWYHIKLDFDCTTDTYDIFVNSTLIDNNRAFFTVATSLNMFGFDNADKTSDNNYIVYFDAVGYSWQNYNVNDNILPILESSESILEVDKDEFALVNTNTFYPLGIHSSYDNWLPDISGGVISIASGDDPTNDRELSFVIGGGGDNPNITKNIVGVGGFDFYMVSQKLSIRETLGQGEFQTFLYDDLGGKISGFKVDLTNATHFEIDLWSQGFFPVLEHVAIAGVGLPIIEIDLLVNYEIDIAILNISINSVFNTTFIKGLFVSGKSGLSKVDSGLTGGFAIEFYLDNTAVYFGGHSNADALGFATIDLGVAEWNTELNNLFTTQINGNLSIGTVEGSYTVSESFNELNDFFIFTNISEFNNVYESVITEVSNPTFVLTLNGSQFSVNTFLIEGVILNENGNEYRLDFTFGNVDISESYFFVNTVNELRFINQVDDNLTEFIQARFNINDVSSNEYAISYKSLRSGNSIGNLRINFTTTSNILEIPIIEQTRRVVLTQNRTIRDIIILVSDDGLLTSGITTGFVSNMRLIDSLSVDTSFLTISIIDMLIPLIMILIPTLAISERYGKDFIVPMFLLMSIVLTASTIIPIWLFFIIALTNSLFIYLRKGKLE